MILVFVSITLSKVRLSKAKGSSEQQHWQANHGIHCGDARISELHHKPRHGLPRKYAMHVQLLKNREEVFQGKGGTGTKERKRSKYKSDEVESMDKVQLLGEAFQKIQMATGIHVRPYT